MQDSGLYNELDEKQMVRYSDIFKGSITKYEGLKDETEKNTYTTVQPSTHGDEDTPNDKYERLKGESQNNIYRCMDIREKDVPNYVSVIDDDEEDKDINNKAGDGDNGYLKPGSRNSQESGISLEKNKNDIENYVDGYLNPVSNNIGRSQVTSSIHTDGYLNPLGKSEGVYAGK